jgi:hypothetical protein
MFAVIIETFPSLEGHVSVATVKTSYGKFKRTNHKQVLLPVKIAEILNCLDTIYHGSGMFHLSFPCKQDCEGGNYFVSLSFCCV